MMRWRRVVGLLVTLAALIPSAARAGKFVDRLPAVSSAPISDFSRSGLTERLTAMTLQHIEGIWQYNDSDIEIAIVRHSLYEPAGTAEADHYLMIVVDAPNRTIRPGTVMGRISRADKERIYTARIYTASAGSHLTIPKTFTITLDNSGNSFSLHKHNSPLQVFLWRFAPYLWRYPITPEYQNITRTGCVRRYPQPSPPLEPVYL